MVKLRRQTIFLMFGLLVVMFVPWLYFSSLLFFVIYIGCLFLMIDFSFFKFGFGGCLVLICYICLEIEE